MPAHSAPIAKPAPSSARSASGPGPNDVHADVRGGRRAHRQLALLADVDQTGLAVDRGAERDEHQRHGEAQRAAPTAPGGGRCRRAARWRPHAMRRPSPRRARRQRQGRPRRSRRRASRRTRSRAAGSTSAPVSLGWSAPRGRCRSASRRFPRVRLPAYSCRGPARGRSPAMSCCGSRVRRQPPPYAWPRISPNCSA